jgi:hypothetical protein
MNPRDRRLRLRKSTVLNLNPDGAMQARGGAKDFGPKTETEHTTCDPTEGCTETCFESCIRSRCPELTCPCEVSLGGTCNVDNTCYTCPDVWTCVTCHTCPPCLSD